MEDWSEKWTLRIKLLAARTFYGVGRVVDESFAWLDGRATKVWQSKSVN
jgi:hypothetical protein